MPETLLEAPPRPEWAWYRHHKERCGFERCRHGQPEVERIKRIVVEWYEDRAGWRYHICMDFCSWECLEDWRNAERSPSLPPEAER